MPTGQVRGTHSICRVSLNIGEDLKGLQPFAVEFVDEGHDRRVAHTADFHQFAGLGFDPLSAVDDHEGAVDRCQDPVGVFGKVLMAGGVEEVDFEIPVVELHHRGVDGNSAFFFHCHPVAGGVAGGFFRLDRSGQLNGTAEEEEFFREGGFPGVGVADDAEGSSPADFFLIMLFHFVSFSQKKRPEGPLLQHHIVKKPHRQRNRYLFLRKWMG